jgi:subtilisin
MRIRTILHPFVLPLCLLGLLFGVHSMRSGVASQSQNRVTAAQLAAALAAQKRADAKLTRSESAARRFQELSANLEQTAGTAAIIVQLAVAFRPEGEIQQEAERLAQREAIRQAQDALLASVFGGAPASLKRFETLPHLAFSVDSVQLAAIQSSPLVLDIYEDIPIPVAQTQPPSIPLIGAPNAWASGYTGAGKTIAILDTGVDKNHPTLSGKVVSEACYSTNFPEREISSICPGGGMESEAIDSGLNCTEFDGCAHGTSIAGIVAGVASGATLISIQVNSRVNDASRCEGGAPCILMLPSDLINGLERVFDLSGTYSIAAANISLGNGRFTGYCDGGNPVKTAIDQLRSVGIATVVASGNGSYGDAVGNPACVSTAISVGATGDGGILAADAIAPYSNSASILSLLAPGYFPSAPIPGGGFNDVSGTSVAAAHVSGALAILRQHQPNTSVSEVLNRLRNSGINVTDPRNGLGKPRIKIDAALSCLQNVPADRWRGEYYDNPNLEGDPVMIRDDGGGFLDRNFGEGSPGSLCGPGADNFSVRWMRTVNFTRNVYRFSITAEDGARLYVDGQLKLDFWIGPPGTKTVDVLLNQGDHQIRLEFRENVGVASASLTWATPCIAGVTAGRWKGEYYDNPNLAGDPLMVIDDGNDVINKDWGSGSPSPACEIPVDNFSVRWTRTANFLAATYRFTFTNINDGFRLYIDNISRIDRWVLAAGTHTVDIDLSLSGGNHTIRFEYFESGGLAKANVSWAPICQVVVFPSAYQSPDPGQDLFAMAVSSPSSRGHDVTESRVDNNGVGCNCTRGSSQTKTCLWHSFPNVLGTKTRITLKFDWAVSHGLNMELHAEDGSSSAEASYDLRFEYSLDNGSSWIVGKRINDAVSIPIGPDDISYTIRPSGSESIVLPNPGSINMTLIRFRDRIYASSQIHNFADGYTYAISHARLSVSNIRLEVERCVP